LKNRIRAQAELAESRRQSNADTTD
jgi:hypothetical protein